MGAHVKRFIKKKQMRILIHFNYNKNFAVLQLITEK